MVFLSLILLSFVLLAQITEYENVSTYPSGDGLGGAAEASQGIASDRINGWYFSDKTGVYIYDLYFSESTAYVSLDDINEFIIDTSCDHIGGIDYVDGYVYAGVDNCTKMIEPPHNYNYSGTSEEVIDPILEIYQEYFDNKYGNIGMMLHGYQQVQNSLSYVLTIEYVVYSTARSTVESCEIYQSYDIWYPHSCLVNSAHIVKLDGETLDIVGQRELLTPDGLPIGSAASISYNPMDGLFYNQCPANITLNANEEERNRNSICGFDFDESDPALMLKSMIDLGSEHPRHLTDHWSNQGGAFAENGVFLYVQDDTKTEYSDMTGFHVYAPDYGKFRQDDGTGIKRYEAERFAMGNISYNPDALGYRLYELEGITVWRTASFGGSDIHILKLLNNVGNDQVSLHHFSAGDTDNDGINDMIDNCPLFTNQNQYDFDNDGIGNSCDEDIDGDGIPDNQDKCIYYNDPENSDVFLCNDGDYDSVCDGLEGENNFIPCNDLTENQGLYLLNKKLTEHVDILGWQYLFTDVDIIDNCNGTSNRFKYEGSEIMYGMNLSGTGSTDAGSVYSGKAIDEFTYRHIYEDSLAYGHYWQPDHNLNGIGDACESGTRYSKISKTDSFTKKSSDPKLMNEYLKIDMMMDGYDIDTKEQSLRYCNLPLNDDYNDFWGKDGYCTNTKNSETYKDLTHKVKDYSFSHGSDPKPFDDRGDTWRELTWTSNSACLEIIGTQQSNYYVMNSSFIPGVTDLSKICNVKRFPSAKTKETSTIYWNWRNDFKGDFPFLQDILYPQTIPEGLNISHFEYALSVGVKGISDEYISNEQINPDHFYNSGRYARSARLQSDNKIGYYKAEPLNLVEPERMIYFDDWLREIFLREGNFFPEKEWDKFIKWSGIWKDDIKGVPVYIDRFFGAMAEKDGFMMGLDEDSEINTLTLKYNNIENSAGWIDAATFGNIPASLEPAGLSVSNGKMFVLMRNEDTAEYSLFNAGNNTLEEIEGLPEMENITFIEFDGNVYIAGNSDGFIEMYELYQTESGEYDLSYIDSVQKPSARTLFNIYSDETGIYLAGGGNTDWQTIEVKRDVWRFDTENGWQVLNSDTGKDLFKLFMRKEGDNLLMVSQTGLNGKIAKYITINSNNGTIIEDGFTSIEGVAEAAENRICRATDGSSFWAGFESAYSCNKFSAPDYSNFNAGTKIYDVEGFGKYVFAAHGNGIRVYDISNPVIPILKNNFSLYGPVKDLEVVADRVFAATGNGIDILKFNGTALVLEKHIATYGNSAVIKRYGNYFIIGDGQGLKKLDIATQSIVQQANTSGDVTTLVITDGIIHLYDWAGIKRYNAETFVKITTSSSNKTSPKLVLTNDNKIFITYSSNVYQLTYNGNTPVYTQKTGDLTDAVDGYPFNGYGYFAKENGIRISTMSEIVEIICGNGVTDPGETCDGNIVQCSTLDSDYESGTASCNSTCSGYNLSACVESDGW